MIKVGNKYSIIKLVEKIPPKRKEFEAIKNRIRTSLLNEERKQHYDDWLENAKKKYGFKIYTSEIEKTIDKSKYQATSTDTASVEQ